MKISKDLVASIHYTLKNDAGELLDSSEGQAPLEYLHGAHNLVPGLEKELDGKAIGDSFSARVACEEGYGEHDEALLQELPRDMFGGIDTIEVGMEFHAQTQHGQQIVAVTKVEGDTITVDGNHPLAGVALNFDIEVVDIREATAEELEQGHVHAPNNND